jgi:large subunit ribosomal protein L29
MAKGADLTELTVEELTTKLAETKEELFNMRFQNATGQLDNYKRLGQLKKDVARLHTLLRSHELGEVSGGTGE